jgi:anti-sigma factor (TIGR02949 family)
LSETEITCDEVLAQVEHYLHGELDPESAGVLARHLSTCSPCWKRAEFQRKLKDIVRGKCLSDQPPAHLVVRVRHSIRTTFSVVSDEPTGNPGE